MEFFFEPLEQFNMYIFIKCPAFLYSSNLQVYQFYHLLFIYLVFFFFNTNKYRLLVLKLITFIKGIVYSTIHIGKQIYLPYICILFLLLFFSNLSGMVPFSFTITSIFAMTFFLSLMFFVGANLIGLKKHGLRFFSLFLPNGVPMLIIPFLVIIEVISYFSRVFSLAIRIFANMMSGHILLKILIGLMWVGLTSNCIFFFRLSLLTLPVTWSIVYCVMFLELIIAFLQAYVFIVLVGTYSNDTINLH